MVPEVGARRCQGYIESFRNEILAVSHAAGYAHPGQFTPHDVEVSAGPGLFKSLFEIYGYDKPQFQPDSPKTLKEPDEQRTKRMLARLGATS